VITKLENGYRKFVTVAEVMAFSGALQVPPITLLVQLDPTATIPVLPGTMRGGADSLAWWRGDRPLGRSEPAMAYAALRTYVKADETARELKQLLGQLRVERLHRMIEQLREYRSHLRTLCHPLPPLPLGLEWIDEDAENELPSADQIRRPTPHQPGSPRQVHAQR
jgi:hypothetical protein